MYGGQKYRKQNLTFGLPGEWCEKMKLGELQPLPGRSPLCNLSPANLKQVFNILIGFSQKKQHLIVAQVCK